MARIAVSCILCGVSPSLVRCRSSAASSLDADGSQVPAVCPDDALCWGVYVVQDWGRGSCSLGERVATAEACDRALADYGRACGGRDREPQRENWEGPTGCHVQDAGFMEFQFNLNEAQGSAPAHAPVCLGTRVHGTACYKDDRYGPGAPSPRGAGPGDRWHDAESRWRSSEGDIGGRHDGEQYGHHRRARRGRDGIAALVSLLFLLVVALAATVTVLICCRFGAASSQMQPLPLPLPMTSMQVQGPQSLFVQLPHDAVAGQTIEVQTVHGRVQAMVPPGVQPGQTIQVQVAAASTPIPSANIVIGRPLGAVGAGPSLGQPVVAAATPPRTTTLQGCQA